MLDYNQIRASNKIKQTKLLDIVFESLRDESQDIRKVALQILSTILVKFGQKDSLDVTELVRFFKKQKLMLVRLTQPGFKEGETSQPADPTVMLKALQVLSKMLEIIPEPNILDEDCL